MEAFKRVEESNLNAFITLNKEEAIKRLRNWKIKRLIIYYLEYLLQLKIIL